MAKRTSNPPFWSEATLYWVKWVVAFSAGAAVFGVSLSNYRPTVKFETDNVVAGVASNAIRITRGELRAARNQLTETQFLIDGLVRKEIRPDSRLIEQLNYWRGEVERLQELLRKRGKGRK